MSENFMRSANGFFVGLTVGLFIAALLCCFEIEKKDKEISNLKEQLAEKEFDIGRYQMKSDEFEELFLNCINPDPDAE